MSTDRRRSGRERGSALLIVFLFAAIVAIMLYQELPSVAFEARRQKEQLLIDRADEYKHAVKLYYRKVGGYPASLKSLEDTNRMRFLRHQYKDPFTGKDDWRLLHMGPGNMLLDSKVNRLKTNGTSGTAPAAKSSGFGTSSNTGAASSFVGNSSTFGSNPNSFAGLSVSTSDSQPAVKVPPVRQRGPAIPAGGGVGGDDLSAAFSGGEPPPMPQELPDITTVSNDFPGTQAAAQSSTGAPGGANADQSSTKSPGANATQMVQGLFGSQSPRQQSPGRPGMGTMQGGGGIAGVASKASGESIKTVDDQSDYSLWEFYYDPTKDVRPGLAGGGQNGTVQSNGPSGVQTTSPGSVSSGPASSGSGIQTNSFSLGNSSFGSESSSPSGTTPGNTISSGHNSSSAQNPPQ